MMLIYIAGPYRAADAWRIAENVHRAETVATMVWEAGHYALCPHANARHASAHVTDTQYLAGTMEMMCRCDAVIVLPGYEGSAGTVGEIVEAGVRGIPVARLMFITIPEVRLAIREIEQ